MCNTQIYLPSKSKFISSYYHIISQLLPNLNRKLTENLTFEYLEKNPIKKTSAYAQLMQQDDSSNFIWLMRDGSSLTPLTKTNLVLQANGFSVGSWLYLQILLAWWKHLSHSTRISIYARMFYVSKWFYSRVLVTHYYYWTLLSIHDLVCSQQLLSLYKDGSR